jgi:hypothetical protein
MRIAIPNRAIFSRLAAKPTADHQVITAPQSECELLLRTARAELALISPLGYGSASPLSDYRIVGTTCLVAHEYTGLATIRFRAGLELPRTYYAPEPADFITTIGLLLMAEQHELTLTAVGSPAMADCVIAWESDGTFDDHPVAIDLTEEWWLAMECGLPLGIWVCRSELADEYDLVALTNALAETASQDDPPTLQWNWNDDAKASVATTLEMLYYHRYIAELPQISVIAA